MPHAATKSKSRKISKCYILTLPHPNGHVMSMGCEQPSEVFTVQVWLLYDHQIFQYCTLYEGGTELRADKHTDRRFNYQMPLEDLSGLGH